MDKENFFGEQSWVIELVREYHSMLQVHANKMVELKQMLKLGKRMPFEWQFRVCSVIQEGKEDTKRYIKAIKCLRNGMDFSMEIEQKYYGF